MNTYVAVNMYIRCPDKHKYINTRGKNVLGIKMQYLLFWSVLNGKTDPGSVKLIENSVELYFG